MSQADCSLVSQFVASPNHGERRFAVDSIILHYTGMTDDLSALNWLRNLASEVSCHYYVRENGEILQLVPEARRAWHAGRSSWQGETDINSRSIGIEIVNAGHPGGCPAFPAAQIAAVTALCRNLAQRYAIVPQRVLAHSDIAPGRKMDPGERFPWEELGRHNVGHWVKPAPIQSGTVMQPGDSGPKVITLQALLQTYGYGVVLSGTYDAQMAAVVAAFQRHFRPALVDGRADRSTLLTLRRLLAKLPTA